ncbi:MAG: LysM domain-containing protein [Phycisphaerae bacterium]|nr:LysM domain-containing protein [Phycisphaerae bacterium]
MLTVRRVFLSISAGLALWGGGCVSSSGAFTNVDYRLGPRPEDGAPAVLFLSDFRVRGVKSEQVKLEVTLLDKRGTPLGAAGSRYRNSSGDIAAGKTLPIFSGSGNYERVMVSLPIEELRGVGRSRPETARFSVYDITGNKLLSEDLTVQLRGADLRRMLDEHGSGGGEFAEGPPAEGPPADAPPEGASAVVGNPVEEPPPADPAPAAPSRETPDYAIERPPEPAAVRAVEAPVEERVESTPPPPANPTAAAPAADAPPGEMEETWGSDQRVPLNEVVETAKRGEMWIPPSDEGRPPPMPPPPPEPVQGESTVTSIRVISEGEGEAERKEPAAREPAAPDRPSPAAEKPNVAPPAAQPAPSAPPAPVSKPTSGAASASGSGDLAPVSGWSNPPRRDADGPRAASDVASEPQKLPASDGLVPVSGWSGGRNSTQGVDNSAGNASPAANASMNRTGARSASDGGLEAEGREYTVKTGDSLTSIAQKMLGSSKRWRDIYRMNRDRLESPDALPLGVRLRIPGK